MRLIIWFEYFHSNKVRDTAGQEKFDTILMLNSYFRYLSGLFLLFDVTNKTSFENIPKWYHGVKSKIEPDTIIILVGNKVDLEANREIASEEGQKLATELGIMYIETSSKSLESVNTSFQLMASEIMLHNNKIRTEQKPYLSFYPTYQQKKRCC